MAASAMDWLWSCDTKGLVCRAVEGNVLDRQEVSAFGVIR